MAKKKKSPSGDNNWLRTFYQLCGLDPARAEIAIARRNKEDPANNQNPASVSRSQEDFQKANGSFLGTLPYRCVYPANTAPSSYAPTGFDVAPNASAHAPMTWRLCFLRGPHPSLSGGLARCPFLFDLFESAA
jgi:hypothetical protein